MKSCQSCEHGSCVSMFQNIWNCSKYPGWQHDGMCPDGDAEEEQQTQEDDSYDR